MCRSKTSLTIFAMVCAGGIALGFIFLAIEDRVQATSYSCKSPVVMDDGSTGVCVPCEGLNATAGDALVTNVTYYIQQVKNWSLADLRLPNPLSAFDWKWFAVYVCNLPEMVAAAADETDIVPSAYGNLSTDDGACCCRSLNATTNTSVVGVNESAGSNTSSKVFSELICPVSDFEVTIWSWLWFSILVASVVCAMSCVLMYIFLLCGCIEPSKGALEILAEGVQRNL